jgi:hypothetical protein
LRTIPCRFNIVDGINPTKGGPLISPAASPADIAKHLQVANIFLRQMALELILDSIPTIQNTLKLTVAASGTPGIFRVRAGVGFTRNVSAPNVDRITQVNFRQNVMNFVYIINDRPPPSTPTNPHPQANLGAAAHFPNSNIAPAAPKARPTVTEDNTHSPTSSWRKPCGVAPDGAATATAMRLIRARQPGTGLFAMFVTDLNAAGTPPVAGSDLSALTYGGTIAHEFGHCLNLGHRVESAGVEPVTPANPQGMVAGGIFFDGLTHPPQQNVMHFNAPSTLAHDFDILQALAARRSPLVPP